MSLAPDPRRNAAAPDGAIPVAPSLEPAVVAADAAVASITGTLRTPAEYEPVDRRVVGLAGVCLVLGVAAAFIAQILVGLISLVTNLAYHGRFSAAPTSPAGHGLGAWAVLIPVLGALVVGVMARWGSAAIRGHGIPEVMEKVLYGESRIPMRVLFLKPLSAAVAIGTGGPFGAEGPIIATGGALGSLLGQLVHVTADERKTLLAAGAAAGMSATFGSPVSAVLLAVELLLFEYRPRSLIPVALAAASAAAARLVFEGSAPMFALTTLTPPSGEAMAFYVVLGAAIGALAAGITRVTYGIEDAFERFGHRFHVHFMWWPAIGAVVVGLVGLIEPRTLGVGYNNIVGAIGGEIVGRALLVLVVLKFVSWAVYLGSGTSGGTLAPLFTIGGGLGAWLGAGVAAVAPSMGVDARVAGLVGMAAIFAGASHALLASIVFAFETTRQPLGLLPLLGGCSAAYLVALLINRRSIMTEKLARRGAEVRTEYAADWLSQIVVRDAIADQRAVVTIPARRPLDEIRTWMATGAGDASHQGYPVVDDAGLLVGVLTRRDLLAPDADERATVGSLVKRPPAVVFTDSTLRDAADQMVIEGVGRLPVVERSAPRRVVGIVSRGDLLAAHAPRLHAARRRATPRFRAAIR
jgi:H+/Cl- antiporter ClcA/CBS domain-containing protein